MPPRTGEVQRAKARSGVRATDERDVESARKVEIVNVLCTAAQEARVLQAAHRLTNEPHTLRFHVLVSRVGDAYFATNSFVK
jgi:hypothetical protein